MVRKIFRIVLSWIVDPKCNNDLVKLKKSGARGGHVAPAARTTTTLALVSHVVHQGCGADTLAQLAMRSLTGDLKV